MSGKIFKNTILKSLSAEVIGRLDLTPLTFELRHEFERPGQPIRHLYFVEEGMASALITFADGTEVEVGMFGYESVGGASALMGTKLSLNHVFTQIAGAGYVCSLDHAKREFALSGEFHYIVLRYVQAQLLQCMQSAACNAKHGVDQRLSRWLLICADRANSLNFFMPHEFLSQMLGSTRPTVTTAAGLLRDRGLIDYTRGKMRIIDRAGLEANACECYGVIRHHLDNYLEFDSQIPS